jgi:hypothetical protein
MRGDTLIVIRRVWFWHETVRVRPEQTVRLEVSRGKFPSAGRAVTGAVIGAGISMLAALTIPGLVDDGCSADVCSGPSLAEPLLFGAVFGGFLGGMTRGDRWERVATPVRLGFGGAPGEARLGVSLAF